MEQNGSNIQKYADKVVFSSSFTISFYIYKHNRENVSVTQHSS